MHRINIGAAEATALIEKIASHLPVGYSLGPIYAVTPKGVVAMDRTSWGLDRVDDFAWRLVEVSMGLFERTTWRNGTELSRRIVRHQAEQGDGDVA